MNTNTTILYYSSNREPAAFEQYIIEHLHKTNTTKCPIVSVTHAPLDLGTNICVGECTVGEESRLQQIWIGLQYCRTPYVVMAESDFIYPPEYFTFIPPSLECIYDYGPIYLLYMWIGKKTKGQFWHKNMSEGARCSSVQYQFDYIHHLIYDKFQIPQHELPLLEKWCSHHSTELQPSSRSFVYRRERFEGLSAVSMRTKFGMNNVYKATPAGYGKDTLPYWGSANELRENIKTHVREFDNLTGQ